MNVTKRQLRSSKEVWNQIDNLQKKEKKSSGTHTLRWSGGKTHRIVRFNKQFYKRLETEPFTAVSIFLDTFLNALKLLLGTNVTIDHDQQMKLNCRLDEFKSCQTMKEHQIERWLVEGIKSTPWIDTELVLDHLVYLCKKMGWS